MKQPIGKNLIIVITLVLAVTFGSQAMALNFEFDDHQYPATTEQKAAQEKVRKQKQERSERIERIERNERVEAPYWMNADLSKEDQEKLKAEHDRFMKATQDLRQNIMSKQLLLQSEIVKSAPDIQKATALQREISDLQAELDQKHLMLLIEIKKISPDTVMGCMGKPGGAGKMSGCPMMGK